MVRSRFIQYVAMAITILALTTPGALAFDIDDYSNTVSYWGGLYSLPQYIGHPTLDGDVIGSAFSVTGLDAKISPEFGEVWIYGPYIYNTFAGANQDAVNYGPGDLFISTSGWNVSNKTLPVVQSGYVQPVAPNFPKDAFVQSEGWDFAVTGSGVYNLNWQSIQWTNGPASGYLWRKDQAWRYGAGTQESAGWATAQFVNQGPQNSYLYYRFDTTAMELQNGQEVGLHWTMRCGNDIIEGKVIDEARVPEPGLMLLLGTGLVGLAAARKRAKAGK